MRKLSHMLDSARANFVELRLQLDEMKVPAYHDNMDKRTNPVLAVPCSHMERILIKVGKRRVWVTQDGRVESYDSLIVAAENIAVSYYVARQAWVHAWERDSWASQAGS